VTQEASPRIVRGASAPEIVAFPEAIDISNAPRHGAELFAARRPGISVMIADMSLTEFCDSSGARYLLVARDQAALCDVELRVVVRSSVVRRVLEVAGLSQLLSIYSTLGEALTARKSDNADITEPGALTRRSDDG
jgi:anti-sigma B factor antagonist